MARAFNDLTGPGRMRRLRPLAIAALPSWDVNPLSVRHLAQSVNAMFRVDADDGQRYVLRVFQAGQKDPADRLIEAHWTRAMSASGAANVPAPIAARDGALLVTAQAHDVPEPRACALTRYIPGKPMRNTQAHYALLGQEMARLHLHSATFQLPDGLRARRYDRVYVFPADAPKLHGRALGVFDADQHRAIEKAESLATAELSALWSANRPQLIHGDLSVGNTLVHKGRLWVIDFEDVLLGFPVQDIAIAFYAARVSNEFDALYRAFQDGYTRILPWPCASIQQLDTLILARLLVLLNFCCNRLDWSDIAGWRDSLALRLQHMLAVL